MGFSKLNLLALSAVLASGLMACDATGPCQQAGYSGARLAACKIGVEQIGPNSSTIADADRTCTQRYDIHSADPNDAHAFDNAAAIADLYVACHKGASCYLHLVNGLAIPDAADQHECDDFASLGSLSYEGAGEGSYSDGGLPAGGVGDGGAEGAPGCEQVMIGGTTRCQ